MATKLEILIEGERRGLLNDRQRAILEEARRRGMASQAATPAATPQAPAQPAQMAPTPQDAPTLAQRSAEVTGGMVADLNAAFQGTTPVVRDIEGNFIRPLAPIEDQQFFQESGRVRNAQTQIVMRDPDDGTLKVFERTPETDESRIESIGRLLGFGALSPSAAPVRAVPSQAVQRARDFQAAGVDPTIGTITPGAARAERALSGTGLELGTIGRAAERSAGQAGAEAQRIAERMGRSVSPRQAGEGLRAAGQRFVERSGKQAAAKFNKLDEFIKPTDSFEPRKAFEALEEPIKQFDNPALAQEFLDPRLTRWEEAIRAGNGRLSYRDMKQFRSEIGRLISRPDLTPDANRAQLEKVYSALTQDMRAAAASRGDDALAAFEDANNFFRERIQTIDKAFRGILGDNVSDEGAFRLFQSLSKEGGARESVARLNRIRDSVSADEWGDVSSAILREMGRPRSSVGTEGFNFSPNTFLTRFNQMSDDAKNALFSQNRELKTALDRLSRVTGAMREAQKFENVSRTGLPVSAAAATAGAAFDPVTTGLTIAGANVAARLMTNPTFVRWYAGALTSAQTRAGLNRVLSTLSATARASGELDSEDVRQFIRSVPGRGTATRPSGRGTRLSPQTPQPSPPQPVPQIFAQPNPLEALARQQLGQQFFPNMLGF